MEEEIQAGDVYYYNGPSTDYHTNGKNYIITKRVNSITVEMTCDDEDYPYSTPLSILNAYFDKVEKTPKVLMEQLFNKIK